MSQNKTNQLLKIMDLKIDDKDQQLVQMVDLSEEFTATPEKPILFSAPMDSCIALYAYTKGFSYMAHIGLFEGHSDNDFEIDKDGKSVKCTKIDALYDEIMKNQDKIVEPIYLGIIMGVRPISAKHYSKIILDNDLVALFERLKAQNIDIERFPDLCCFAFLFDSRNGTVQLDGLENQNKIVDVTEKPALYNQSLGIPEMYEAYSTQTKWRVPQSKGFLQTSLFLRRFYDNSRFLKGCQKVDSKFINWGYTELVYVLNRDDKLYAMTVGQPKTKYGVVRSEYENLKKFGRKHPETVVKPIYYFGDPSTKRELYIAPYITQARCISNDDKEGRWGRFVPEPVYRFEPYSEDEVHNLLQCMIAKLVLLYDEDEHRGIANFDAQSGDFILDPGVDKKGYTIPNILEGLKLITIRGTVNMPLQEYLDTIRKEFVSLPPKVNIIEEFLSTMGNDFVKLPKRGNIINISSKNVISPEDIERGIQLGLKLKEDYNKPKSIEEINLKGDVLDEIR